MAIILALIILLSAGVSVGAQNALPGDLLYPVKTNINEKIEDAFAIGDEADARLAANLAVERLKEAEALAAKGRLDARAKAEVEDGFEKETKRANAEIENLKSKNKSDIAAKISTQLNASLSEHGRILGEMRNTNEEAKIEIEDILGKVRVKIEHASSTERGELKDDDDFFDDNDEREDRGGNESTVENEIESNITTDNGKLELEVKNNEVEIYGKLTRANPCIEWNIKTSANANPASELTFDITKRSTAEMCVQVLGTPQEIKAKENIAKNAKVTVKFEGKIVFSGNINK